MKIGIIGAMEIEVNLIREKLLNKEEFHIKGFIYHCGKIADNEVVMVKSGIGKVSSAIATALLINEFSPDLIINTGTAGGLQNAKIYDIVLANEVAYYDVDLTIFGYKLGQQAAMPKVFVPDEKWLNLAKQNILKHTENLHFGQVVSGDSFINDPQKKQWIQQNFPHALAVEMEAAAIAQTCHMMKTPFLLIRAISDNAGEGDSVSYDTFVEQAGKVSAQMNIHFIENIK